ncbi:hypothetical protein EQG49_04090 [Periweissella cryptocerci]|uniref:Uncharacterized protein n=1 Tax=Periweissella cryptocerci TaxID=2506420 RepID=A0A4P6YST5_9LACO|nr:hypothetical protein [Periweissella cryptocerci]QBO35697.1 hypothetical protein EQG49_04090 [Periweissella cryptocerci]
MFKIPKQLLINVAIVTGIVTFVVLQTTIGWTPLGWIRSWLAAYVFMILFNAIFDPALWDLSAKFRLPNLIHGILQGVITGFLVSAWLTFLFSPNLATFWTITWWQTPIAGVLVLVASLVIGKTMGHGWLK